MILTEVETRIKANGFEHFGFAKLERPLSFDLYRRWIDDGLNADMDYLKRHLPFKENPQLLMPKAHSAIVIGQPYFPTAATSPLPGMRVALYAQDSDYHLWFFKKLNKLIDDLKEIYSIHEFLCYTDSKPVAERDLAARAGLGWIGKNGCLIDRQRGSLFFIGEIFTTLELPESSLVPDHCGTCSACITACPTQAIRPDRTLDASRCISYWTIESKKNPPKALRPLINDWFFGCDICQTVCPWNQKAFGKEIMKNLTKPPQASTLEGELRWCLTASNSDVRRLLKDSPILRAGSRGLKRNALVVIANLRLKNLRPEVEALASRPELQELALWTLERLRS